MAFYEDMAAMARDILKPDTEGGLGQGAIDLVRTVPGIPDPERPWVPVEPTITKEAVNHIGQVKAEYVEAGTIIVTDYAFMIEPPQTVDVRAGDGVEQGGVRIGAVVRADRFPPHGVEIYRTIFVNR